METTLSNLVSLDEYRKKKQAKTASNPSLPIPSFYYPFVWVPVYFYYNPSFSSPREDLRTPAKVMNASY